MYTPVPHGVSCRVVRRASCVPNLTCRAAPTVPRDERCAHNRHTSHTHSPTLPSPTSRHAPQGLPQLLEKFKADHGSVRLLLNLPCHLQPHVISDKRHTANFKKVLSMLKTLYIDSAGKEGVMQPVAESIKYLTTSSHSRTANINSMVGEIGQHIQDRLTDAIGASSAKGSAKKSKKKSPKKSADDASAYPQAGEVDLDKEFSLKVVLKQLSTLYKTMDIEEYVDSHPHTPPSSPSPQSPPSPPSPVSPPCPPGPHHPHNLTA